MPILDNLFSGHLDNLSRALNRTAQRHGLLINNLANVNTPGYKRRDVDFATDSGLRLASMRGRTFAQVARGGQRSVTSAGS